MVGSHACMERSETMPKSVILPRVLRIILLAGGLLLAVPILRIMPGWHDLAALLSLFQHEIGRGPRGAMILVGGGALCCAVGMPRQVAAFVAGGLFGVWAGTGLALAAQMLGCAASFIWARCIVKVPKNWHPYADRLLQRPFLATLAIRLLPVGNNLLTNVMAGASPIRSGPFFAASMIGYLPQTIIFALLGQGMAIQQTVKIIVGLMLLIASLFCGRALLRR